MIRLKLNTITFLGLLTLEIAGSANVLGQKQSPKPIVAKDTSRTVKDMIKAAQEAKSSNPSVNLGYLNLNQQGAIGSFTNLSANQIKELSPVSVDALMQGQVAGAHVVNTSGASGSGAIVNIRGISSFNAGTTPLYIVDGVPVKAIRFSSPLSLNADNDPLADINPADIASIIVLKDAYSTAPYGMRGANGVVIINTYGGTTGKTLLDFSATVGFLSAPKELDVLNADQYRTYAISEETSRGRTPAQIATGLGRYLLISTPANQLWRYSNNTDWQKEVLSSGLSNDYHLLLRGGDAVAKYSVNVGYTNQLGVVRTSSYDRFSTRFNLDYKIGRKLSMLNSISFVRSNKTLKDEGNTPNTNPLFLATLKSPALTLLERDISSGEASRNPDSADYAGRNNPYSVINRMRNQSSSNRINGRVTAQYTFSSELNLRIGLAADYDGLNETRFIPSAGFAPVGYIARSSSQNNSTELMVLNENVLSYEKSSKSDNHHISAYIGNSFQSTSIDSKYIKSVNSVADQFTINTTDPTFIDSVGSTSPTWRLLSFFAGTQYNYKGKYTIGANIRADGSSRFTQGHQWGYFPSVAGSWNITKESFMQPGNILSNFSLKASYGITGNQEVGYYSAYNSLVSAPYDDYSGVKIGILGNKNFKWEQTTQFDGGADIAFFKSNLGLSIDYYDRKTDNLLNVINIPGTSGFNTYVVSEGSIRNRGLELTLTGKIKIGAFSWLSSLNGTFNKNTILSMPDKSDYLVSYGSVSTSLQPGNSIGGFYGYSAIGVYAKTSDVNVKNGATNGVPFKGGDVIFEDLDHNGIIDANDRKIIGNTNPKVYGGFSNTFSYKMFDLGVLMDYAFGNQVYNAQRAALESMSNYDNQSTSILSRWNNEGDISSMPRLQYGDPAGNNRFSSRWIEDGSYVRFKAVTLGYNMPLNSRLKNIFKNARISVTGQNLYTFSKYKGYGPEVGSAVNPMMYGADYASLPQLRSVFLSIKLGL
jgi:TonB-linked SusC/RagA family outer membrane protein